MVSMYWQIMQANRLRKEYETETGIKYDFVIRARPDHRFETGFTIENPAQLSLAIWVKVVTDIIVDDTFALAVQLHHFGLSSCCVSI